MLTLCFLILNRPVQSIIQPINTKILRISNFIGKMTSTYDVCMSLTRDSVIVETSTKTAGYPLDEQLDTSVCLAKSPKMVAVPSGELQMSGDPLSAVQIPSAVS